MRTHRLHDKYKKHEFWLEEVLLLGHVISVEGIKVDLQKGKAVTECRKPTNLTDFRNFLELAGYCGAFGRIFQR